MNDLQNDSEESKIQNPKSKIPDAVIEFHNVSLNISGKQMPLGGPYLSTAQIAQIMQWIAAGPQNN